VLTSIFTKFATQLTEFENYETRGAYEIALTQKLFVLNLITSYLGIFLTAFVYVPFGTLIIPYLDIFSLTVRPFAEHEKQMQVPKTGFTIDENRLRKQVIYFAITAQVVNLCMELVVPYLKRRGFTKIKEIQSEYAMKRGGAAPQASENDVPDEAAFLARVRKEAELDTYDVTSDLREMVIQVRNLSLESPNCF
jgi:anoctamin-10